jgi:hypothetical protein
MKAHFFFTLTLLSIFAFGCQKEMITPEAGMPTSMKAIEGHYRPAQQCGASAFTTFNNGATSYGSLEILNDAENLYLLTDMNNGWFLADVKIFAGDPMNLPKGSNGQIQTEEFGLQISHTPRVDRNTYSISTDGMGSCLGVTVWAHVVRLNMMGHQIGSVNVWANGSSVLNGFSYQYCQGVCNNASVTSTSTL